MNFINLSEMSEYRYIYVLYDILNFHLFFFISFWNNIVLLFLINRCCGGIRRKLGGDDHAHQLDPHTTLLLCLIRLFQVFIYNALKISANWRKLYIIKLIGSGEIQTFYKKVKKEQCQNNQISFFVRYMVAISNTRCTQNIHNFQFWKLAANLYGISTRSFQTCSSVFSSSRLFRYTGRVSLYTYPMTNSTRRLDIARSSTVSYKRKILHHIPVYHKKGLI